MKNSDKELLYEISGKIWYELSLTKYVDWYTLDWDPHSIKADLEIEEILLDKEFISKLVDTIYSNKRISKLFSPWKKWILEWLWYQFLTNENILKYLSWLLHNVKNKND